jgi:hypothetical protein
VVTQADIVARAGYWASPSSDGSRFYRCPILGACVGGVNGSRAVCATGYDHVACSLCADGYFEQFGLCVACPKSSGTSIGVLFGLCVLLIAVCGVLFLVRDLLPIDVMKLGVSMVQIIASANSAYDIPWPSTFRRFLSLLRVFLVDVVAVTQASCAQPMNYYASVMVVCVGLKLLLALLVLGPWAWSRFSARDSRVMRAVRGSQSFRRMSTIVFSTQSPPASIQRSRAATANAAAALARGAAAGPQFVVNWVNVFKASFMLLFVAYPGVSLKVLRLFKCREIDGVWWLAADMRLRCYDGRWAGFALYGLVMAAVYVVGLPVAVLWILWRRRRHLFGSPTDLFVASTRATFGFLYLDYGASAWWWEVEELLRKLLLSAVVVLIEDGSPLQVTLAVLVSGWAHVLHAQYKPWGIGSVLYGLQHGALFVTSFVFLMGLLFKVDGVSSSSGMYTVLSGVMVTLCLGFIVTWVAVVVVRVVAMWRSVRRARSSPTGQASSSVAVPVTKSARSSVPCATLGGGRGAPLWAAGDTAGVAHHDSAQSDTGQKCGVTDKPRSGRDPSLDSICDASDGEWALGRADFVVMNPLWRRKRQGAVATQANRTPLVVTNPAWRLGSTGSRASPPERGSGSVAGGEAGSSAITFPPVRASRHSVLDAPSAADVVMNPAWRLRR